MNSEHASPTTEDHILNSKNAKLVKTKVNYTLWLLHEYLITIHITSIYFRTIYFEVA